MSVLISLETQHNNMVSLQAINRFDIARSVPLDGQISFPQLAESIGMKEKPLRCLLRHAMTMRIFSEPHKGMVAHTSVSKMLMQPHVHDWMNIGSEEMWPAAVRVGISEKLAWLAKLNCL